MVKLVNLKKVMGFKVKYMLYNAYKINVTYDIASFDQNVANLIFEYVLKDHKLRLSAVILLIRPT